MGCLWVRGTTVEYFLGEGGEVMLNSSLKGVLISSMESLIVNGLWYTVGDKNVMYKLE